MFSFRRLLSTVTLLASALLLLVPTPEVNAFNWPDCQDDEYVYLPEEEEWGCNPKCDSDCDAFVENHAEEQCETRGGVESWEATSTCGYDEQEEMEWHECEGEYSCILEV